MVPTLNIPGKNISISNSEDILKYLYGHVKSIDEEKAKFLEPSQKTVKLEEKFDKLGHCLRTYIYYNVRMSYHFISVRPISISGQQLYVS